jgi:hypothetical protein
MMSSLHRLIPFLPLFCNYRLNLIPFLPISSQQAGVSKLDSSLYAATVVYSVSSSDCVLLSLLVTDHTENTASIVKEACLLVRCLAVDVLLLHAYASRECVYQVVA